MRASALFLMLVAALAGPARALELGTLLTTPEERERLERLRSGAPEPALEPGRAPAQVTGFVKRSDGRDTLWVDGVPLSVNGTRAAPLLKPGAVRGYSERKDGRLHIEKRPPG